MSPYEYEARSVYTSRSLPIDDPLLQYCRGESWLHKHVEPKEMAGKEEETNHGAGLRATARRIINETVDGFERPDPIGHVCSLSSQIGHGPGSCSWAGDCLLLAWAAQWPGLNVIVGRLDLGVHCAMPCQTTPGSVLAQ